MQKSPFGNTGYEVSRLGFGAMRLPRRNGRVDFEESSRILRLGFERGINFFDSHHFYHGGESEEAIGRALKGLRRRDYVIQTKIGMYNDYSEGACRRLLEGALEKLGVDYIDFYLSHSLKWTGFLEKNALFEKFTSKARKEGLIRHVGFSSHDSPGNILKLIDTGLFSAALLQYNFLNRANEEPLRRAASRGMGVSVMGPAGGGRLISDWEERKNSYGEKFSSPAELAIKFVLANKNVHTAFSGMSSAGQVEENAGIVSREKPLSEAERLEIARAFDSRKKLLELYCTGCGYCMPCPSGVDIPSVFDMLNLRKVFGFNSLSRKRYEELEPGKRPQACSGCGECETKCPQNIPIRKKLREAAEAFGE